jgi:hypothetical protein
VDGTGLGLADEELGEGERVLRFGVGEVEADDEEDDDRLLLEARDEVVVGAVVYVRVSAVVGSAVGVVLSGVVGPSEPVCPVSGRSLPVVVSDPTWRASSRWDSRAARTVKTPVAAREPAVMLPVTTDRTRKARSRSPVVTRFMPVTLPTVT